jgi:hypothetical protein
MLRVSQLEHVHALEMAEAREAQTLLFARRSSENGPGLQMADVNVANFAQ